MNGRFYPQVEDLEQLDYEARRQRAEDAIGAERYAARYAISIAIITGIAVLAAVYIHSIL